MPTVPFHPKAKAKKNQLEQLIRACFITEYRLPEKFQKNHRETLYKQKYMIIFSQLIPLG